MAVQVSELLTDYPELYDDFVFRNSMCWVCYSDSLGNAGIDSLDQSLCENQITPPPFLLGCIGVRHCSTDTAENWIFFC